MHFEHCSTIIAGQYEHGEKTHTSKSKDERVMTEMLVYS